MRGVRRGASLQHRESEQETPGQLNYVWMIFSLYISSLYLYFLLMSGCRPPRLRAQDLWSEEWPGLQAGRHNQASRSDILMNILFVFLDSFDDNKQLV